MKRPKPSEPLYLYQDSKVTISESHISSSSERKDISPFFEKVIQTLIKHIDWIDETQRWNLWSIASYVGAFDLEKKWPLFSCVTICYEHNPGESVISGKNICWKAYRVQSEVYNINYIVSVHVVLK